MLRTIHYEEVSDGPPPRPPYRRGSGGEEQHQQRRSPQMAGEGAGDQPSLVWQHQDNDVCADSYS
eukprot:3305517-Pyramimonas_sp.AAC.1